MIAFPQPPKLTRDLAVYWRVTERTIARWRAKGAPLHDIAGMLEWSRDREKLPRAFIDRIAYLTGAPEDDGDKRPDTEEARPLDGSPDPNWAEFEKQARGDDPKLAMEKIARARDYAAFRFEKAAAKSDRSGMKFYGDLLAKMESVLHDAQLRAKKLGLDEGQLLPRGEVERIAWALAYWALRAVDLNLDALSVRFEKLGLSSAAAREVLEPELLSDRFLVPFARAAKIQGGTELPEWLVAKMREACGDFLEKGEAEFDAVKEPS